MTDGIGWGYYVGSSENPTTTNINELNTDKLYYPYTSRNNDGCGYWLASPSANYMQNAMCVHFSGEVTNCYIMDTVYGFRPIVCLPSSILQ